MTKYLLTYYGGSTPEGAEAQAKVMAAWTAWIAKLGKAMIDIGNPTIASKTIDAHKTVSDSGTDPITGYSIIEAADMDEAIDMAKGCPIFAGGGRVVVSETMNVM